VPTLHACSLISKEAFQRVGGYDEKLYVGTHAKEEVDFYYRIRRRGYKVFFQPGSTIYHHHIHTGGCETNNALRVNYYEYRNSLLFFARFHGILYLFKMFFYPILRMTFPKKVL
jgi:GT2 family glycosyltransferase